MKLVVPLVLGLALAAGLLPPTTAMQGTYRGPGDHVPWNHARASSGSTPAPQEPAAPPDEPRRRPADLDAPAVEAAAPDLPTPPGPVDPTRWSWWWAFNRDGYLDLRRHVLDARTLLGTDDFLLGAGQVRPARSLAPDEEVRRRVIGPALRQALEQGPAAVRAEALLALAKLHPAYAPSDVPLAEQLASHLAAGNRREAEAAVVALGWLGAADGLEPLLALARDDEAGRALVERADVPARTRALAVLALALRGGELGGEYERLRVVRELQALLAEPPGAAPDLHVACVTALGLVPLRELPGLPYEAHRPGRLVSDRKKQVALLLDVLADPGRDALVRAHVPRALALLGEDASRGLRDLVKQALLEELERGGRARQRLDPGIVEALGALGDADAGGVDADVRAALRERVRRGALEQRGPALVALGLASSRLGEGETYLAALPETRTELVQQALHGRPRLRPWAALALGVQSWHARRTGAALDDAVVSALLEGDAATRDPLDSGAWSVALGLCGDRRALPTLRAHLEAGADDGARGHAAVALGLLGVRDADADLARALREAPHRPELLGDAAVGLALLGRKDVSALLDELIDDRAAASVQSACLTSLGEVGDGRAVDALLELLQDEARPDLTRARAAAALGRLCEPAGQPWTAAFLRHANYLALTDTLLGEHGTGLLGLR